MPQPKFNVGDIVRISTAKCTCSLCISHAMGVVTKIDGYIVHVNFMGYATIGDNNRMPPEALEKIGHIEGDIS